MPRVQRLVVGAVIVDDAEHPTRVLAARRAKPPVGQWEFPGGKVEVSEAPEAALARELAEELGVRAQVLREVAPKDGGWPINDELRLRLFLVELLAGEPTPGTDHSEVRWIQLSLDDDLEWLPSDRAALPEVRAALG